MMHRRSRLADNERVRQNNALATHLQARTAAATVVAAYLPIGSEPGTVTMLDELVERGIRVLLPMARNDDTGRATPLHWAQYRPGELVSAPFGLSEPSSPVLAPDELAAADLVVIPALAVDRRGNRLGRGAGFYDRSLGLARRGVDLIAMLYTDEVVSAVPAGPFDVPVTHALTAEGFITLR